MNAIQQLRADVKLPSAYRVKMPVAERKSMLIAAISELKLREAFNIPKKKRRGDMVKAAKRRLKIVRVVAERGPITTTEINEPLGIGLQSIRIHLNVMIRRGYIERLDRKRVIKSRAWMLYAVTDAGRKYGETK